MSERVRFATAIHVLVLLAMFPELSQTSSTMAASINTNAVVVRRIIALLQRAGLVVSQRGPNGGATLAVASDQITLGAVYDAIEEGDGIIHRRDTPNPNCPVGRNINTVLGEVSAHVEEATHAALRGYTIERLVEQIRSLESAKTTDE